MTNSAVTQLMSPLPSPEQVAGYDPFGIARRLDVPIWVYDIDHAAIIYANDAACSLWQADDEASLRQRDLGTDMSSTVERRLKQYQSDFEERDAAFTELWTLYPNGAPRNVMVIFRGFLLPDGRMAMQCEAVNEISNQPQNLRSAEALLHTDVMISLFSADGPPLYLNPAARKKFVSSSASFAALFVNHNDFVNMIRRMDQTGEHRQVSKVFTSAGQRWYDITAKHCSDAATGQPAILMTAIDVSELKEARDKARHMANRDQLTGMHNRTSLQHHIEALRDDFGCGDCALIFFDVDRFKLVNDRYGHEAGDTVLRVIAERIGKSLRHTDIIARLGGDEFVILMHNVSGWEHLSTKIAFLRGIIGQPIYHGKTQLEVTVSIGVAEFQPQTVQFTDILRDADVALYASKQSGRNCVTFYSEEMGEAAKGRDRLEIELKTALKERQFVLHYQPRYDLKSGTVVSAEGLVRWEHPERGLIPPDTFIPICEDTGMIATLGQQVLEMGVAQAIAWREAGLDIEVSLNISPRQFNDKELLPLLSNLAQAPNFPRGKIELEVTENVLIGDHEMIAEKLRTITHMGYRIAIDDFGTGYSNLSYISKFPLKCIKIDRSFIDRLPASGPIIQLILTLARQIGATAVSEGVETTEQLEWLRREECGQVQGFLLKKPLRVADFNDFMQIND